MMYKKIIVGVLLLFLILKLVASLPPPPPPPNLGSTSDSAPPYTSGHSPASGAVGVPVNTSIVVHVMDDTLGVEQSSIVMTVEGSAVTPTITGVPGDYTVTYDPSVDFPIDQVVDVTVAARDIAASPNVMATESYSFTITSDATPPSTSGHSPVAGTVDVPADTSIVVHVLDAGLGVDQSSIVMTVEGSAITPTITGAPADYTVTYDHPVDFPAGQVVGVTISAQDLSTLPNVMIIDSYSFTIVGADAPPGNGSVPPPTPPTPPTPPGTGGAAPPSSVVEVPIKKVGLCEGCMIGGVCVVVGVQKQEKMAGPLYYCDVDGKVKLTKDVGDLCMVDYECEYYLCDGGYCNVVLEGEGINKILIAVSLGVVVILIIGAFLLFKLRKGFKKISEAEDRMDKEQKTVGPNMRGIEPRARYSYKPKE